MNDTSIEIGVFVSCTPQKRNRDVCLQADGWYIFTERFGCYFVELLTSFEKLEQIVPLCCLATAKQLDQL